MSSLQPSEHLQAGKPVRRSAAGTHLSIGPGNHGKLLLTGDGQNEFQSHASSRRPSGNEQKLAKLQEENDQLKQELEDLRFVQNTKKYTLYAEAYKGEIFQDSEQHHLLLLLKSKCSKVVTPTQSSMQWNRKKSKIERVEQLLRRTQNRNSRFQYRQLIDGGQNQCLDERRVTLLKSQVLQLERQVMLLTEGLSSRAAVLLELGNALQAVFDKLQSLLTNEDQTPEVQVSRVELIRIIEICQSMQDKLQRNHQTTSVEKLALPWLSSVRQATKNPLTLLDLCYGKVDNLNLLYVSALEGKLSTLFRHLNAARQTLSVILAPGTEPSESTQHVLPTVTYSRLINHLTRCNQSLEECCRDLLTMTLIVPSAPWAKMECTVRQEFTVENVLAVLPAFPKGAPQQRAKRAAEALVKAANYSRLMAMQQVHALEAELDFHRGVYNLQVQYTQALFQGIKQAYHNFQENVVAVVCSPLKDVLSSYADLKAEASETALRNFLTVFKNNAELIQDAVDTLTPSTAQQHEAEEAFSKLGKEFFISLDNSLKNCREERDRSLFEVEKLRQELDQALDAIRTLKRERKHKGSSSNDQSSKSEEESTDGKTETSVDHTRKIVHSSSQVFEFEEKNSLTSPLNKKETPEEKPQQNQSAITVRHRGKSLQRSKSVKMRPSWQV